jgi:hypothetical protein
MRLYETKLLRITPLVEPVSAGGRAFIPATGMLVPVRKPLLGERLARWMRRLADERGDITASGAFFPTWRDILDASQLAINLDLTTHKDAIFGSATTPNFSSDTAYGSAPYNADEKSGGSWPVAGVAIGGTGVTESPTGTLMWDGNDVTQVTSTFTGGEGGLIYATALGSEAICLHDFGSTASPNNGTMTIAFAAGGILNIDLTP